MVNVLLKLLGWTCVGLAIAGVALPLLPTTPFLLVALWAFAKSSPALAHWVREHPVLGLYVRDWECHRIIPVKAKVFALTMMAASFAWLALGTNAPTVAKAVTGCILVVVAIYITTRPGKTEKGQDI